MSAGWEEFADHVKGLIRKEMNGRADGLLNSSMVKNIEDYRYGAGVLKGLAYAEDIINEALKKAEGQDDD